jgi:hypothetical protein
MKRWLEALLLKKKETFTGDLERNFAHCLSSIGAAYNRNRHRSNPSNAGLIRSVTSENLMLN